MAIAAVQEFLDAITTDSALQEEVAKAMEGADDDRQAVTELARARGYDFTADELAQEIANRESAAEQRMASGELSEEDLEAVAGGKITPALTVALITLTGDKIIPSPRW